MWCLLSQLYLLKAVGLLDVNAVWPVGSRVGVTVGFKRLTNTGQVEHKCKNKLEDPYCKWNTAANARAQTHRRNPAVSKASIT
jgi:hypothetical protein